MTRLHLALFNQQEKQFALELCQVPLTSEGKAPEWVQLVPAGEKIKALDGRSFSNKDPQAVVDAFNADPRDVPLDWNHSTERKAPFGNEAPAAAWITAMEVRAGGAIWGKVDWTARGAESLTSKAYRYLSPSILTNKAKNVVKIVSAALTNRPALDMPALAHHQENFMDPKLLKLLGLEKDATQEQIDEAFGKYAETSGKVFSELETLRANSKETDEKLETLSAKLSETETKLGKATDSGKPDIAKFVPREDYDLMSERVKTLEESDRTTKEQTLSTSIDIAISEALRLGKIVPANREFYAETCKAEGGLEKFQAFVKSAPAICAPSDLDGKDPPVTDKELLTADHHTMLAKTGLSEEEYRDGAN